MQKSQLVRWSMPGWKKRSALKTLAAP